MHLQCPHWDRCESISNSEDYYDSIVDNRWHSIWEAGQDYCRTSSEYGTIVNISELIGRYSSRNLKFAEDYLNAFLGVLRFLEKSREKTRHYWGIPLVAVDGESHFTETFLLFLEMTLPDKAKRREGFPSWSWLGWSGRNPRHSEGLGLRRASSTISRTTAVV